ncbi:MAG: thioredoxin domain-containing protein [Gemmatimonadota bacterium]
MRHLAMTLLGLLFAATGGSAQKADLDGVGHWIGDEQAPVVVVEYSDFACGACALFASTTWPVLHEEFVATGEVRWLVVPFELGFRNSEEGARAGECAADQDAFWSMKEALYRERSTWVDERNPEDELVALAGAEGLDAERFRACYDDKSFESRTESANEAARSDGVRGTPTFFINGFQVQGALPPEAFRQLLRDADAPPG